MFVYEHILQQQIIRTITTITATIAPTTMPPIAHPLNPGFLVVDVDSSSSDVVKSKSVVSDCLVVESVSDPHVLKTKSLLNITVSLFDVYVTSNWKWTLTGSKLSSLDESSTSNVLSLMRSKPSMLINVL